MSLGGKNRETEQNSLPAPSGRSGSPSRGAAAEYIRAQESKPARGVYAGGCRTDSRGQLWVDTARPSESEAGNAGEQSRWLWETAQVRIEGHFLTLAIWDQNPVLSHASTSVGPMAQCKCEWAPRRGSEHDVYTSAFQVLSKCLPMLDKDHSLVTKCLLFHSEEFPHNFL